MKLVEPIRALERVGRGRCIVASPGCGAPTTLLRALGEHPETVDGARLYSGLLLGEYPFLDAIREGIIRYGTWHVMPPVRELVRDGVVDLFCVRGSQVPRLIDHLDADTAFVRVSPPDRHGFCSLGPSVSYVLGAIRRARCVVAEIDDGVPRVHGEGNVHISELDLCVEATEPAAEYRRAPTDAVSQAIARHIMGLLPAAPTLQIGIGAIPEALVDELLAARVGGIRFVGMGIDGFADLHDAGLLARDPLWPHPPVMAAELMGTRRLMEFADGNPAVALFSTGVGIDARYLGRLDGLISINSAIAIDRHGQVNAEWAGGRQISGVGGSLDFGEAALQSTGGMRILAFPSTAARGARSRIVDALEASAPVSLPRTGPQYVVTEFGVAELAYASQRERLQALAAIAHPDHAGDLVGGEVAA